MDDAGDCFLMLFDFTFWNFLDYKHNSAVWSSFRWNFEIWFVTDNASQLENSSQLHMRQRFIIFPLDLHRYDSFIYNPFLEVMTEHLSFRCLFLFWFTHPSFPPCPFVPRVHLDLQPFSVGLKVVSSPLALPLSLFPHDLANFPDLLSSCLVTVILIWHQFHHENIFVTFVRRLRGSCFRLIKAVPIAGGVTLLRAAAKNHERVSVICDPADYAQILVEVGLVLTQMNEWNVLTQRACSWGRGEPFVDETLTNPQTFSASLERETSFYKWSRAEGTWDVITFYETRFFSF